MRFKMKLFYIKRATKYKSIKPISMFYLENILQMSLVKLSTFFFF